MSKIAKINFIWTVCVLVAICIALAALWVCDIDTKGQPILHYLSITATILSITLSFFSIAFSYYSLASSQDQWSKVSTAIGEMRQANENIKENNQVLLNNVITITDKIGEMNGRQSVPTGSAEDTNANKSIAQNAPADANSVRGEKANQSSTGGASQSNQQVAMAMAAPAEQANPKTAEKVAEGVPALAIPAQPERPREANQK